MAEKENKQSKAGSDFLNFNASWITMVIYIAYLGGMIFLQKHFYETLFASVNGLNYYVFIFLSFIFGILLSALFYNVSKVIVAKVIGYDVVYLKLLGFTTDFTKKEKKTSFRFLDMTDIMMKFAPKDDDIEKNPRRLFLSGLIGEAVFEVIALILFFALGFKKDPNVSSFIGYMSLFAGIYGLIMVIYEFLPFRQDKPTDFFNLATTKSKEEQSCFNICAVNFRNELSGKDFLVPTTDDYSTYYPVHALYYVYLDHLYKNELEAANKALKCMKENIKKFDENERYLPSMEDMYLHYLINDEAGADRIYLKLRSEDKANISHPQDLGDFRTAISVFHHISKDEASYQKAIKEFEAKVNSYPDGERVKNEKRLFQAVRESIEKTNQ